MIRFLPTPKGYTTDSDKAVDPAKTLTRVSERLQGSGLDVLKDIRRVDTGRLGIPVFIAECGETARAVMPTRKQMGKGASEEQARASALMELMERYSFFSYWATPSHFRTMRYSQAQATLPRETGVPVMELPLLLASVQEDLDEASACRVLDLTPFRFCKATRVGTATVPDEEVWLPLDWFKTLSEFNGSSAGNTHAESVLQGGCELVERHVCALIDREQPSDLPTIDPAACPVCASDPVIADLLAKYTAQGIKVLMKDASLGMGVPTVIALAHDPATFPGLSEIVVTAGTAATPAKACVRALTEVAQLAGDFATGAVYEPSGLGKPLSLEEIVWLQQGPATTLPAMPSLEAPDILDELRNLASALEVRGHPLFSVETTAPELSGVATAHYSLAPGLAFRERDPFASLGLFVGRRLAEEADEAEARAGLDVLAEVYGEKTHFIPFFQGLLALRLGQHEEAVAAFAAAEDRQPDEERRGLAAFYTAYAMTQSGDFTSAEPCLSRAIDCCPDVKEYFNLRGVARYKAGRYEEAAADFSAALGLDRGSATDLANLGLCQLRLGQTGKGRDFLETALELDPTLDFARNALDELKD